MNVNGLRMERHRRREELRRARAHLTSAATYYDLDHLVGAFDAQLDVSARAHAPLVALVHGLAALGFDPAASARLIRRTPDQIADALAAKITFDAAAAAAVDAEVAKELPASLLTPDDVDPKDRALARSNPESLMARG